MLPTLAFPNRMDSALYLAGFGVGTVFAMMAFSFVLGLISNLSSQLKKEMIYKSINAIAGFAAIFVGIFWLWSTW